MRLGPICGSVVFLLGISVGAASAQAGCEKSGSTLVVPANATCEIKGVFPVYADAVDVGAGATLRVSDIPTWKLGWKRATLGNGSIFELMGLSSFDADIVVLTIGPSAVVRHTGLDEWAARVGQLTISDNASLELDRVTRATLTAKSVSIGDNVRLSMRGRDGVDGPGTPGDGGKGGYCQTGNGGATGRSGGDGRSGNLRMTLGITSVTRLDIDNSGGKAGDGGKGQRGGDGGDGRCTCPSTGNGGEPGVGGRGGNGGNTGSVQILWRDGPLLSGALDLSTANLDLAAPIPGINVVGQPGSPGQGGFGGDGSAPGARACDCFRGCGGIGSGGRSDAGVRTGQPGFGGAIVPPIITKLN